MSFLSIIRISMDWTFSMTHIIQWHLSQPEMHFFSRPVSPLVKELHLSRWMHGLRVLKGICYVQVTSLFSGYVSALLAEHASNPAQNWKAKDCAMYLVVALAVRGRTTAAGVTATNQLVDIQDFFNQQVRPA